MCVLTCDIEPTVLLAGNQHHIRTGTQPSALLQFFMCI